MTTDNPAINQVCDECQQADNLARYEINDTELFLCPDCAAGEGFCLSCGGFFGGTEEFFYSGINGFCRDCVSEYELGDGYEPDGFEY